MPDISQACTFCDHGACPEDANGCGCGCHPTVPYAARTALGVPEPPALPPITARDFSLEENALQILCALLSADEYASGKAAVPIAFEIARAFRDEARKQ